MASTIEAFDCHFISARGEKTSLAGQTVTIYHVEGEADLTTAVIDSDSQFPETSVSPSAGATVRIRIENDGQGRAGYIERTTV